MIKNHLEMSQDSRKRDDHGGIKHLLTVGRDQLRLKMIMLKVIKVTLDM